MVHILVIEDDPNIRGDVAEFLLLQNYQVTEAPDGLVGLQLAHEILPDLILCDASMPYLDGYEVLHELRHDSLTATIPFIFLTARSEREDQRRGMLLGADDYITKPFTFDELINVIGVRLEKSKSHQIQHYQELARGLVDLQEDERRQMAAILQTITQQMTGLKMTIGSSNAHGELLRNLTDQILMQVNALSQEFYPTMLEYLGLVPTLLWQVEHFMAHTGIEVRFTYTDLDSLTQLSTKLACYRIIQEGLSNIAKYARVTEATLQIWVELETLHLIIKDEGVGFNLSQVFETNAPSGLIIIQERVYALGGEFMVVSELKAGTSIIVKIPLSGKAIATRSFIQHLQKTVQSAPHLLPVSANSAPHTSSEASVRILIAENYEILRHGLRAILSTQLDFEIVGELDEGSLVLESLRDLQPDILIMDFMIAGINGLDLVRRAIQLQPNLRVVILSTQSEMIYIKEAFQAGIAAYLLKKSSGDEIIVAIQEAMAGRRFMSSLLNVEMHDLQGSERTHFDSFDVLTRREREVLHLSASGRKTDEIAEMLVISPRTAETHRTNIMRKLALRTQADLVRYAIQHGVIHLD